MKTDEELVKLAQNGDYDAECELFSRYKNLLRKISRSYFLIGGDVEDLLQEGMIGLYKAVKGFDVAKNISFASFAGLCVKRQVQTAIKKATSQKNMVLSSALPLEGQSKFDDEEEEGYDLIIPSPEPTIDEVMVSEETLQEIKAIIRKKLSKMELMVLSKYLKGQTYKVISESTGLNEKSIDNALSRIKKKLEFLKKTNLD